MEQRGALATFLSGKRQIHSQATAWKGGNGDDCHISKGGSGEK